MSYQKYKYQTVLETHGQDAADEWLAQHREKAKLATRRSVERNRDKYNERQKKYRAARIELAKDVFGEEGIQEYIQHQKTKTSEYDKKRYENNKEKLKARSKQQHQERKDLQLKLTLEKYGDEIEKCKVEKSEIHAQILLNSRMREFKPVLITKAVMEQNKQRYEELKIEHGQTIADCWLQDKVRINRTIKASKDYQKSVEKRRYQLLYSEKKKQESNKVKEWKEWNNKPTINFCDPS